MPGEKGQGLSAEFLDIFAMRMPWRLWLRTFEMYVPHPYNNIDPNRDLDSLNAEWS